MLYKLYISKSNPDSKISDEELDVNFTGFQEIYKQHNVKIVGAWRNAEDPLEEYLITAYMDADHYGETVSKMKANKEYQELSKMRAGSVESTKVITLNTLPGSPIKE
jgi:hypothetical protein